MVGACAPPRLTRTGDWQAGGRRAGPAATRRSGWSGPVGAPRLTCANARTVTQIKKVRK